jgi:hypothetical protein
MDDSLSSAKEHSYRVDTPALFIPFSTTIFFKVKVD